MEPFIALRNKTYTKEIQENFKEILNNNEHKAYRETLLGQNSENSTLQIRNSEKGTKKKSLALIKYANLHKNFYHHSGLNC